MEKARTSSLLRDFYVDVCMRSHRNYEIFVFLSVTTPSDFLVLIYSCIFSALFYMLANIINYLDLEHCIQRM